MPFGLLARDIFGMSQQFRPFANEETQKAIT